MAPVIHYYQHTEGGAVHGFTHPLPKEIAKQVRSGELAKVADAEGADPDTVIAALRAQIAALTEGSGIDPSSLETAGLADTAVSGDETPDPEQQAFEDEGQEPPDPDAEDDDEVVHPCLECGEPVERRGKTGPWPSKHPECK